MGMRRRLWARLAARRQQQGPHSAISIFTPQAQKYCVYASMVDDANEGWVWLPLDISTPARSVIRIKNPSAKKSVCCEAHAIDRNFVMRYNDDPKDWRFRINVDLDKFDPVSGRLPAGGVEESPIVLNSWYRDRLGGLQTRKPCELVVTKPRVLGSYRASRRHPQVVVRMSALLGALGLVLGAFGFIFGFVSIVLSVWSVWLAFHPPSSPHS
jgi:hypothetical protein